ncbi:PPA1309 family protein [Arcanobacterium canis]|uniref:PPA1309 family protein n=1 Tax=Arcanobacterium canis TaxID=999183 RepID=A0ABY8G129_9ACTO|nr:PPA1309 family protein [Arcanobacterium canis]WFM82996.1 PPA1309 family protein [Arcanobacterium canis]
MDDQLSLSQIALRDATADIESHVNRFGWDGPVRVFALINARAALDAHPALAGELPADVEASAITDPHTLFSVEQEDLPHVDSLEELFGSIMWPPNVDGAAISTERVVLPPNVEVTLPDDEAAAMEILKNHPERQDVRIVASVMRSGESWCIVRMRHFDDDSMRISSPDAVPGLVEGLRETLK